MLSPQIYIVKSDKILIFKLLDCTSHKVSSLVIAGAKTKARKGTKNEGEKWENAPYRNEVGKSENEGKKGARKGGDMTEKR